MNSSDCANSEPEQPLGADLLKSSPFSFGPYIVTTLKSGIAVIHRQRAQERIFYERLANGEQNTENGKAAQKLMFPVNCTFSTSDSELLTEILPDLQKAGFDLTPSPTPSNPFQITATPHNLKESDVQSFLEQTINDYKSEMLQKFHQRDNSICLSVARQMAAKTGNELKPEEIQSLIAELFSCQAPDISPSGKRIMFILSEQKLAEMMN
jgi:DNA mismatch repair protein MutL